MGYRYTSHQPWWRVPVCAELSHQPKYQCFRDVEVGQPYSFSRSVETTNHIGRLKVLGVIKMKVLVPSQLRQSRAVLDSSLYLAEYEFVPQSGCPEV